MAEGSVETYVGFDDEASRKKLKRQLWVWDLIILAVGLILGGIIGKNLFFYGYSFDWNNGADRGYFWSLAVLAVVGSAWLAIELLQGDSILKIHLIAKRVLVSQGGVGVGIVTLAISALGVEDANNGLWYVAGVGTFWALLAVVGFSVGFDAVDIERAERAAGIRCSATDADSSNK